MACAEIYLSKKYFPFLSKSVFWKALKSVTFASYTFFDDPLIFSLKLAEFVSNSEKTLNDYSNEIPSYPYEELKFKCPDSVKFDVNDQLEKTFLEMGYKVETIDGVKIWLDGGWVLLRPSNTQPVIRMFVEAKDDSRLSEIKNEFQSHFEEAVRVVSWYCQIP